MEEKITPPKVVMTVCKDGSYDINIPKDAFGMLEGIRTIFQALLDYVGELPDRDKMTFILSEHLAHQDFESKMLQGVVKNEILHKSTILQ